MTSDRERALLIVVHADAAARADAMLDVLAAENSGRDEHEIACVRAAAATNADALRVALESARIVVVAVRAEERAAFLVSAGRPADVEIAAGDADAAEQLRAACAAYGEWTQVGLWGGAGGALEVSLGSALHAMKVPLRGAALCSVQAATLTFASARLNPPGRVAWVAFVAAGLKAFSPGGGRVRPMVAISVQGALFGAAVQLLGWNLLSVTLGGAAIGLWAALQGVLVQYLLLGDELVSAYEKVVRWVAEHWQLHAPSLPGLLVGWALLHAALATGAAAVAWRMRAPPRRWRELLARTASGSTTASRPRVAWWRRLAREFARWQFWVPLALVAVVLLASGRPWEDVAWLTARFVALGVVFFALLSLFQPARLAGVLRRRGWWGPAVALSSALERREKERS